MSRVDRILFDHIAIGMPKMADAAPFLAGELGGEPDVGGPSGPYTWGTYRFEGGGSLEILEPRGVAGFLHRFLAERGPGIHHVTFKVPSLDEASARARAHGYEMVGVDRSNPHWQEAFLHPRQAMGIVVQIVEASGLTPPWPFPPPPGPAAPPPPVTLLGLRLSARDRDRARAQWADVLGGEAAAGGAGELVFRWPGSPMRLAVDVDPEAPEGPVAIEYASDRPVDLPAGRHPVLGVVFARAEEDLLRG